MSREKQIEEMARFCCNACEMFTNNPVGANKFPCVLDNDYKTCHLCIETAEHLYNAGYRKQSEGEWIYYECVSSYDGAKSGYSCSCCNAFVDENVFDTDEFHKKFCGNCGASMKGGAE